MSARFRKTRRYKKVVCCVLNLCTRFFHQTVHVDQTVHSLCARFRKKRRYTKVVCCVLNLCTRFFHQTVHVDQTVHSMCARFRKKRRYTKIVCCVLMILPTPVLALQLCENALKMNCQCYERHIPQEEALCESPLLRAELVH